MKLHINDTISWISGSIRETGVVHSLHVVKNGLGERCVAAVVMVPGSFKVHAHKLILVQESAKIKVEKI